jgi:hypothetical protein
MAAQAVVEPEGTLEIHQRTSSSKLEVGALPRFAKEIEMDEPMSNAPREFNYRQAAAVHGNAVAQLQPFPALVCPHDQTDGTWGFLDAMDGACFFDDAAEHGGEGRGQ